MPESGAGEHLLGFGILLRWGGCVGGGGGEERPWGELRRWTWRAPCAAAGHPAILTTSSPPRRDRRERGKEQADPHSGSSY